MSSKCVPLLQQFWFTRICTMNLNKPNTKTATASKSLRLSFFLLAKEDKLVGVLPLPEADCFHERRHRNHSTSCVHPHASILKSSVWKQSARQPFNLQPAASDGRDGADLLRHTPTTNNDTLSGRCITRRRHHL